MNNWDEETKDVQLCTNHQNERSSDPQSIKRIISINLETKGKTKGQIIKMIDSEIYEEIKTDINIEQLERQLGEFFIDSSDGDCKAILIVLVSLSSNSFWLFSSW